MLRIDFNRLRFLVIDDNAHMRRIVRTLLHGFGAREVYEAEDGASGLEAFTHFMPESWPIGRCRCSTASNSRR
jgi:two-component system, chemotaxis family, chemotaxis protein CheY